VGSNETCRDCLKWTPTLKSLRSADRCWYAIDNNKREATDVALYALDSRNSRNSFPRIEK